MKSNIQLKYGNYVAFGHFHGIAVNNLGLFVVKNSRIKKSVFENIELSFTRRNDDGGLIVSVDTIITECSFLNVKSECLYNYAWNNMIRMYGGSIYNCEISNWTMDKDFFALCLQDNAIQSNIQVTEYCSSTPWLSTKVGQNVRYLNDFFGE